MVEEANDIGTAYLRIASDEPARGGTDPPSLNDMFDIVATRTAATQMHPPVAV